MTSTPSSSRVAAKLLPLLLLALVAAGLSGQSLPEAASPTAYSALAPSEIADMLEQELSALRSSESREAGRVQDLLAELSERKVPDEPRERAEAARAWKAAAQLVGESEGHTPMLVQALLIASSLNPEDEALAREAAHQERRQELVRRRLERAEEARAARKGHSKDQ